MRLIEEPQMDFEGVFRPMMRSFAIFILTASGFAFSAAAQLPSAPGLSPAPAAEAAPVQVGPAKIAVIAFQLAVGQTNEGQRGFGELQKKYAPREATLKSLSDEVDNLTKQLQAQGASLSDAERATRAKAIDDKKKQLDRDSQDARNDFQQDMQDMYNQLASKVYDVMQAYSELQGFTLILDISPQQSPVLYASDGTNITKPVIDAYNVKSGVPAPAAGEQGAPGAQTAPRPKPATPTVHPSTSGTKPATQH
jgi:outer membrane protein